MGTVRYMYYGSGRWIRTTETGFKVQGFAASLSPNKQFPRKVSILRFRGQSPASLPLDHEGRKPLSPAIIIGHVEFFLAHRTHHLNVAT